MRITPLLVLGLPILASCGFNPGPVPPATTTTYPIQTGAPTSVSPGVQAGYGIAANVGNSFRIVWTGDAASSGSYREFTGAVWTTGHFVSVTPGCVGNACPLESNDFVSGVVPVAGGERVDWDTIATTGIDGFDFVTDGAPVYFDCLIDGARDTQLIQFPAPPDGHASIPSVSPFGLLPQ